MGSFPPTQDLNEIVGFKSRVLAKQFSKAPHTVHIGIHVDLNGRPVMEDVSGQRLAFWCFHCFVRSFFQSKLALVIRVLCHAWAAGSERELLFLSGSSQVPARHWCQTSTPSTCSAPSTK